MKFLIQKPIRPFSEYIDTYWGIEYTEDNSPPHIERVIPNGTSQIIFHFGDPFMNIKNGKQEKQQDFILCGINKNSSEVMSSMKPGMIGVVFKPFGLKPFFNLPMNYLTGQTTEISELSTKYSSVLKEHLLNCETFQQRIDVLNSFLFSSFSIKDKDKLYIVKKSISLINYTEGSIPIHRIADKLYLTKRSLERIFLSEIGTSPKFFARLARFQKAIKLKINDKTINMISLSYRCGYYDQSHFIRDFTTLSGLTPKVFFKQYFEKR